jgi:hypothetical protein
MTNLTMTNLIMTNLTWSSMICIFQKSRFQQRQSWHGRLAFLHLEQSLHSPDRRLRISERNCKSFSRNCKSFSGNWKSIEQTGRRFRSNDWAWQKRRKLRLLEQAGSLSSTKSRRKMQVTPHSSFNHVQMFFVFYGQNHITN